jgi:hypothetical protein
MIAKASERRCTAIHEAGHAVAKMRLELSCGDVSIIPDAGRLGWVAGGGDADLDVPTAEKKVLASLAGYGALATIDEPDPDASCDDDFEKAKEILDFWRLPGR